LLITRDHHTLFQIYFVPGFFDSQDWSSWSSVDGILGWNSAWSMDANDITTALDASYLARLKGKSYMPAVSVSLLRQWLAVASLTSADDDDRIPTFAAPLLHVRPRLA
jgi:hypothetical protein